MKICFLFLFMLFGCSSPSTTHFQGLAYTHTYHIQIGKHLSTRDKKEVMETIEGVFEEVDIHYNRWNPLSDLSRVNEGWDSTLEVNEILSLAINYKEITGGLFDPLLGGVIATWKESLKEGRLPTLDKVQGEIDLDGMLKGYAIDLLIDRLAKMGYHNVYIEWGGDIRTSGNHAENRPWRILVGEEVVELEGAIATSGNEQQKWKVGSKEFTHIIDPHTLEALEVKQKMSVTVKAPTCALADALATACMTHTSSEEALKWAEEIKRNEEGVEFWIVTKP